MGIRRSVKLAPVLVLALVLVMSLPVLAGKPDNSQNGTTLAAYKTIDICVVDPTDENPSGTIWRYSGEIAVWNQGAIDTQGLTINDWVEYKAEHGPNWLPVCDALVDFQPGEIAAGTTMETATTFEYYCVGDSPPEDLDIRNNASLTILNHSGSLGTPKGPAPNATYDGPIPPPPCEEPPTGCTYTQGYWGTHSKYGPAPYDSTWETVGEDTAFFLSGTTWYGAITTNPQGGNAYWQLANQYVAAVLNGANGAPVPTGVQTTLDLATAWFGTALPSGCGGSSCGIQRDWAAVLDDYNNGDYEGGPPHCGDEPLP